MHKIHNGFEVICFLMRSLFSCEAKKATSKDAQAHNSTQALTKPTDWKTTWMHDFLHHIPTSLENNRFVAFVAAYKSIFMAVFRKKRIDPCTFFARFWLDLNEFSVCTRMLFRSFSQSRSKPIEPILALSGNDIHT